MRFELLVGHTPVLNAEIVIGDGFLAIALLVMALGQEIGRQKAPDLAVPMHAAAADAGAEQEGAEAAHRQRLLIDVVANRQRIVCDVLKQVVTPHVTQFVLREARREIRRRVTPGTALQGDDREACIAELLAHDGAGPTKSDKHGVDRFQGRHGWLLVQPGRPLSPTVGNGTRSP